MAHNSKRNKRHTTAQDGDDYVYPTKKVRETKTRARRSDRDHIEAGLMAHENPDEYSGEDQDNMDDYNDMITEFNAAEDKDDIEDWDHHHSHDDINDKYDRLHDDLMADYGYDWEDH